VAYFSSSNRQPLGAKAGLDNISEKPIDPRHQAHELVNSPDSRAQLKIFAKQERQVLKTA
jgi:hypothetical protein